MFAAIVDSARPAVLEAKKPTRPDYGLRICRLYSVIVYLALAQGLVLTVGAPLIVRILYGKSLRGCGTDSPDYRLEYAVCLRGQRSEHMDTRRTEAATARKINLAGAVLNIAANSLLIPLIGIEGSGGGSVGAQALVNVALCFALPTLRPVGKMLLQGINPCRLRRLRADSRQNRQLPDYLRRLYQRHERKPTDPEHAGQKRNHRLGLFEASGKKPTGC